ncbi:23973_t:CDS:1 [Cetraspora pellucida]|uniref:23973_t:CDS:1 n=1 Tax=Cetraspora pellucida TaxID=1433469 RepID=A0A9N8W3N5_9GLOM|nr:23973_t:CDS:1 [Cetraspora pellucida]
MSETPEDHKKRFHHEYQQCYRENKKIKITAKTDQLESVDTVNFHNGITNTLTPSFFSSVSNMIYEEGSTLETLTAYISPIPVNVTIYTSIFLLKACVYP